MAHKYEPTHTCITSCLSVQTHMGRGGEERERKTERERIKHFLSIKEVRSRKKGKAYSRKIGSRSFLLFESVSTLEYSSTTIHLCIENLFTFLWIWPYTRSIRFSLRYLPTPLFPPTLLILLLVCLSALDILRD